MRTLLLGATCLALAGCSKGPQSVAKQETSSFDVAEPAPAASASPQSAPQIAYSYAISYTLYGPDIAVVQAKQVALCTASERLRCQIVKTEVSNGAMEEFANGETTLLVDSRIATEFGKRLDAIVVAAGGKVSTRKTTAEDVTKQIVDTDARVRAKRALADRLLGLIKSANGKVGDLVAAEKAFADTQEELDAARSLQAQLRQRVVMSVVNITYASSESGSILAPIRRSAGSAGLTLGSSMAALVTVVIAALPWAALLAVLLWIWRRLDLRWPFRRRDRAVPASSAD